MATAAESSLTDPAEAQAADDAPQGPRISGLRWMLRIMLVLVAVSAVAVWLLFGMRGASSPPAAGDGLVITLAEGDTYGMARVYVGQVAGEGLSDDQEIRDALAGPLAGASSVLIKVAPGVYQREVSRVWRLVNETATGKTIRMAPLE